MARNGLTGRERVCVSCENPSPGPIKLLYYRWRLHGPFFPLLERLKNDENARLFSNGRVPVCTSCANYLQRQWNDYERKNISLPIDKRIYRLLSDERWEKMNRKKQIEAERQENERSEEISSYDDNELKVTPNSVENPKPFRKSKIPRLANPRRELAPDKTPEVSLEIVEREIPSDQEIDERVRTAASKMAEEQRSKFLRKMAEVKFQEELDYVQKKVQKTMGMVHLKGREERVREIELELEEKMRNSESRNGRRSSEKISPKPIMPFGNEEQKNISELKQHIEKEMAIQRLEMDKLRKNIKNEIAQAMDESYRRNEELWQLIKEMNTQRRGSNYSRRSRPHSDGDFLNKLPKPNKRMARHERTSDEYETDQPYNGYR